MFDPLLEWARAHPHLLNWAVIAAALVSVGALVFVPLLVARLPADYFARAEPSPVPWAEQHPALRVLLHVVKNLAGALLVLAGLAMLVLPGQGLLTILAGVILLDFPGKRRAERAVVGLATVRRALDWIRVRAKREPLVPPEGDPQEDRDEL